MRRGFFDDHRNDSAKKTASNSLYKSNNKVNLVVCDHAGKAERNCNDIKEKDDIPALSIMYLLENSPMK